jgi:hypothetical protein
MHLFALSVFVATSLTVAHAWAGIGDPVPPNPCSPAAISRSTYAILDVSGSGGACVPPFAETAITCTIVAGNSLGVADVVVEFYDETTGASISGPVCVGASIPAGTTVNMVTNPLPPPSPFTGFPIAAAGSCGPGCFTHGSARVFSDGRLVCSAQRIDLSGVCIGGFPVPLTTKDLTVVRKGRQTGD